MKRLVTASGALLFSLAIVASIIFAFANADEATLAQADARVWVAHLAPFAATVPDTAVTVRVNGADALTDFQFGETSGGYLPLPAGVPLLVEIVLPGDTVAMSGTFTLTASTDYTVAAIGDVVNQPLELFPLVDDNTAPPAGKGKVRIAHLAPFANTLPATEVDIRADDGTLILANVPYKGVSPYLELPTGIYDLKITTPGGGTDLLDIEPIVLTDGEIVGAFAIGDVINQPVQVLPLNYAPASMARAWVAHLAPFAATLPGTAVTVRINGVDALTDFQFGETSGGYVDLPATTALVEIVLPGDTVAISGTFSLAANTDYTMAAIGDVVNQPLELLALVDDNTAPPIGQAKVRIGHLAPFAASLPATAVDIRADDGTLILPNVAYKDVSPYLTLPAGTYDLKITTPGGGTDLFDIPPLSLGNRQILGAFAVGDVVNQPLAMLPLAYAPVQPYLYYLPIVGNQ